MRTPQNDSMLQQAWNYLVWFITGRQKRFYGLPRDFINKRPDPRHPRYVPSAEALAKSKLQGIDWRPHDGPIFNQGQLGSCVANGWLGLFMFLSMKAFRGMWKNQSKDPFIGARLQLYYDARAADGDPDDDAGTYVHTAGNCLATTGVAPESMYPYDISKFAQKPPQAVYDEAKKHKIAEMISVEQNYDHIKACLTEGFPIVFGFVVYSSFEGSTNSRTGVMPMPAPGEAILGGHCVEMIGYVDEKGVTNLAKYDSDSIWARILHWLRILFGFQVLPVTPPPNTVICRNSWGIGWGDAGYFYMPKEYVISSNYCSDFKTAQHLAA